jgi:hypothetical protein
MSASISVSVRKVGANQFTAPLRMSPVLRFALRTAVADPDGKPTLLPLKIPKVCCGKLFSCKNQLAWKVNDGRNEVWMCRLCFEGLWESGQNVLDYQIERLD